MPRTWFITGASTGIGRAIAQAAVEHGDRVAATVRKAGALDELAAEHPDTLAVLIADVTDHAAVDRAVADAVERFGGLDVVVNNAGSALLGAVEEFSDAEWRATFDANVFGAVAVLRAALPHLRAQRSGHVFNLTSVGGLMTFPGAGPYSATKYALEAISSALSQELEPLGIGVTAVEPGQVRTDFAGRSARFAEGSIEDYAETAGAGRSTVGEMDGTQSGDPAKLAARLIAVLDEPTPPRQLLLGDDAVEMATEALGAQAAERERWRPLADIAFEC